MDVHGAAIEEAAQLRSCSVPVAGAGSQLVGIVPGHASGNLEPIARDLADGAPHAKLSVEV